MITLALLATALTVADPGPRTPGPYAILPGREPLVRAMLEQPGLAECACTGLSIARDHLVARYECSGVPHAVALHAPETPGARLKTGKFAIFTSSEHPFPAELLAAIERSVRTGEREWRWERGWASEAGGAGAWPLFAVSLALIAAGLWGSLRKRSGPSPEAAEERPSEAASDGRRWLEATAVAALAFGALLLTRHSPPVNLDTARDLLIARDVALGRDELPAIPSSFPHARLLHGGLWLRLLAQGWRHGTPINGLGLLLELSGAVSVGLTFALARRSGLGAALFAAALQMVLLHQVTERPVLWNPALLPLLVAAFAAAALSRRPLMLPVAGLFAGAASQAHVLMVTLLPTLLFAGALQRGVSGALLALGAFGAAWSIGAEVAATGQLRLALAQPAVLAGLLLFPIAGLVVRRSPRARRRCDELTVAAALAVGLVATLAVARTATAFAPRYAAPLLTFGPLALALPLGRVMAAADRKGRWARRIGIFASLAATLLVLGWGHRSWQRHPTDAAAWTLDDARRVASALRAEGFSPRDSMERLSSPHSPRALLGAVLALDDGATGGLEAARRSESPLVFKSLSPLPEPLPAGWRAIPLERGHAVVRARRSVLDHAGLELCVETSSPPQKRCAAARPELRETEAFSQRAYPSLAGEPEVDLTRPFELRATLPYRLAAGEEAVTVFTPGEGRRWRIEAFTGTGASGELPAQSVRLGPGPAEGRLVLTYRCLSAPCLGDAVDWRPEWIETVDADAPLVALMPLAN